MTNEINKSSKTWITCGFFKEYNEAKEKIAELGDKFDLYKIKRVKDRSKEASYKLKVWKKAKALTKTKNKSNNKKITNY